MINLQSYSKILFMFLTLCLFPTLSHAVENNEAIALELQDMQNNIQILPTSETDPTHVDQRELKLMGKGLISKHSKEVLGLACVNNISDSECEILRFVHFTDLDTNYIGSKFKIKSIRALKRSLKRLNSHSNDRVGRASAIIIVSFAATMTTSILIGSLIPSGIFFAVLVTLMESFQNHKIDQSKFWNVVDFIQPMKNALASDSAVSVTNQNSWNWSVSPHRIRDSVFKRMISEIKSENFIKYNSNRVTPIN